MQKERLQHRVPGRSGAAHVGEAAPGRCPGSAAATTATKERVRRSTEAAPQDHPRGRRRIKVGQEGFFLA